MPFQYLTSFQMRQLEPELVRLGQAGRVGFDVAPIEDVNASRVRWRQRDNYRGMQNMRGLNGEPISIKRPGTNLYEYEPGYYGDFDVADEAELTERTTNLDILTQPVNISDIVSEMDATLLGRELDRMEWAIWTLLGTGTITVYMPGEQGPIKGFSYSFTLQTATTSIPWSTTATATPIANLQSVQLLGQYAGKSVDFGAGATAYMNSYTANQLLNNTNAADLGGKRGNNGGTLNTLNNVREFLIGQNLPKISVYDNGYIDDYGTYQKFIPNSKAIIIGARPNNVQVAAYVRTRNMNKPLNGKPGSYRYIKDSTTGENTAVKTPPSVEVHRGHNGGPVCFYPSAIYVLNV